MKTIGLDLGNKTLGIAISDDLGFLSRPFETFRFADQDFEAAKQRVLDVVQQEQIGTIVLGLPKHMDGSIGEQGTISQTFKASLEDTLDIPILLWDERLTSKMASSMMKEQNLRRKQRKQTIDAMAAVIILQSYLDKQQ